MGKRFAWGWTVVGIVAALLYSNFLFDWALRGFTGLDIVVSYLESPGQPYSTLLRVTNVVCAVLVVAVLPLVRRGLPNSRARELTVIFLMLFAIGATVAAIVPVPCEDLSSCEVLPQTTSAHVHALASTVSEFSLLLSIAAAWLAARQGGPRWVTRVAPWLFWVFGVGASLVFLYFELATEHQHITAYLQRVRILSVSTWLVCLGVIAQQAAMGRTSAPHSEGERHE